MSISMGKKKPKHTTERRYRNFPLGGSRFSHGNEKMNPKPPENFRETSTLPDFFASVPWSFGQIYFTNSGELAISYELSQSVELSFLENSVSTPGDLLLWNQSWRSGILGCAESLAPDSDLKPLGFILSLVKKLAA